MAGNRICCPIDDRIQRDFPMAEERNLSIADIVCLVCDRRDPVREVILNQPAEFFAHRWKRESPRGLPGEVVAGEILLRNFRSIRTSLPQMKANEIQLDAESVTPPVSDFGYGHRTYFVEN
jgi:hypothetical protein